jgi:hypothetical protein
MSTAKRYTTARDGVFDSVSGVTLDAGICGEEPVKRTRDGWDEPAPPSTLGPHFHRYGIVGHSRSIGWLLLPLPDTSVVDDHVVLVADPADGDVAEREVLDPHSLLHSDHYTPPISQCPKLIHARDNPAHERRFTRSALLGALQRACDVLRSGPVRPPPLAGRRDRMSPRSRNREARIERGWLALEDVTLPVRRVQQERRA